MNVLEVDKLAVSLGTMPIVRGISFSLPRGGTLGLVGESGSGKSMTALALMQLLPAAARMDGAIRLNGEDILNAGEARLCALRGDRMAMIFQEPMTSLNPVHTIGDQIAEPLLVHGKQDPASARRTAMTLLSRVGIADATRLSSYPHQLSGGQRQRAMIAMALACRPDLLIADEPTSALDVTVQAQIIDLLRELADETGMTLLIISHDLGVIGRIAERVMVMYGGAVMEEGPTESVFAARLHPYTQALFAALPSRGARKGRRLAAVPGTVPPPNALPPGCPFYGRCPRGQEVCRDNPPPRVQEGGSTAYCFYPGRDV
ncbi:MAG TPA: ABC transporter ATP-binding protein [Alphaproteobacteria bacterium]|nr:ABC transporter ATP-binding protein [Alphaproteobacteria bacterium]